MLAQKKVPFSGDALLPSPCDDPTDNKDSEEVVPGTAVSGDSTWMDRHVKA